MIEIIFSHFVFFLLGMQIGYAVRSKRKQKNLNPNRRSR